MIRVAQQLRDTADERAAVRARVDQLRAEGIPVLSPADVPANPYRFEVGGLVYLDSGESVADEDVATLPGQR